MKIIHPEKYQQNAAFFDEMAEEILLRLEWMTLKPKNILDLGCKAGYGTTLLKNRYPDAEIIGIDESEAMINYAKSNKKIQASFIHQDLTLLPFDDLSVDLIFANALLPTEASWPLIFTECSRVLRPDGLFIFTTLGPDTLQEINSETCNKPRFIDMHILGDGLMNAALADPVLDVETMKILYRDKVQLLTELNSIGLLDTYDEECIHVVNELGKFPITYEVIYGHAFGSKKDKKNVSDENIVKIPVSKIQRPPK